MNPVVESAAPPKRRGKRSLVILLSIVAIGGGIAAWQLVANAGLESTDNAQIEAEIVPVPARVGGVVVEILVHDNQHVAQGDIIARIDDVPAKARLAQAEAAVRAAEAKAAAAEVDARIATTNASGNFDVASASKVTAQSEVVAARTQLAEANAAVKAAEAAYAQAKADRDRDAQLQRDGVVADAQASASRTRADVAASNLTAARAHVASLRAGVDKLQSRIGEVDARIEQTKDVDVFDAQAKARAAAAQADVAVAKAARDVAALELDYTTIRAPQAGVLSKRTISVGQMLAPGQAVGLLVTESLWVAANFKETQVEAMHVGQAADIAIDAFPGVKVSGQLESLAGATGARFSLLPPDNATGNYTKVVQRVPMRVRLTQVPAGLALRPGLSVHVTVDTRDADRSARTAHVD